MTAPTEVAQQYLAAWNETEPGARRAVVAQLFAEGARYVDPMVEAVGHDQIDATIAAVQAQFPGFAFSLLGPVDGHHRQLRLRWALGPAGEEPPVIGADVVTLDERGRVDAVLGFLDRVPGGEAPVETVEAEPVASYAVGLLSEVRVGAEIEEYLERIEATMTPFGGRFLIHGEPPEDVEGQLPGDLIVIAFPEPDGAAHWYRSADYQAIADLRRRNSTGSITLHLEVPSTHRATDVLRGATTS